MTIAITFSKDSKLANYGCSWGFIIYKINNSKQMIYKKTILNSGIKGREIADLLAYYKVNTVIVKGIGENAKQKLNKYNINVIVESKENIEQIINKYCNNQ